MKSIIDKKLYILFFFLILLTFSASADDVVTIANSSTYDLSFKINGICSSVFGTRHARTETTLHSTAINKECEPNENGCNIIVFSQPDCTGIGFGRILYKNTEGAIKSERISDIRLNWGAREFWFFFTCRGFPNGEC